MLLFSTILNIKKSVTREQFINLVVEWNNTNPRDANVIPDVKWNGESSIRFGGNNLWMEISEYRNHNITYVRYEKIGADGTVWDTDYILNLNEGRLAIQLDRSYNENALGFNHEFSTPHFITLLIENGFLADDENIPVLRTPLFINEANAGILAEIINGANTCELPIVYISKKPDGTDPVDVKWLASRLKGVAHVLVQENAGDSQLLRDICESSNEYNGAVGIYYPNLTVGKKRLFYKNSSDGGKSLLEKIIRDVIQYVNSQKIETLYTWQGVNNSLLNDRLASQIQKRAEAESAKSVAEKGKIEAENARDRTKDEIDALYGTFDEDLEKLQQQVAELTKSNESLRCENQGLRGKLNKMDDVPVLIMGDEMDLYPGETKEFVLSALEEYLKSVSPKSRRYDVLSSLTKSNGYEHIIDKKTQTIKNLLKGYNGMNGALRKALTDLGFEILEDGKHYKLVYHGDERYWTTLAKTPSDGRGGKNVASEIINSMF